jgi:hypothetical protein
MTRGLMLFVFLCEELDIIYSVATVRAAELSEKIVLSVEEVKRSREIVDSAQAARCTEARRSAMIR